MCLAKQEHHISIAAVAGTSGGAGCRAGRPGRRATHRVRSSALVAVALLTGVLGGVPGSALAHRQARAARPSASLRLFPVRSNGQTDYPGRIVVGSDGALWFTATRSLTPQVGNIGRISTSGAVSVFALPGANPSADGIAAGGDGALWFSDVNSGQIGRITTSGSISEFAAHYLYQATGQIATGPDGSIWVPSTATLNQDPNNPNPPSTAIDQVSSSGTIQEFDLPGDGNWAGTNVGPITAGPDGALWFGAEDGVNASFIGRMTTGGAFTAYRLPNQNMQVTDITTGPDGALWFTEINPNDSLARGRIARITTQGQITEFTIPNDPAGNPLDSFSITRGPDGALWFTAGFPTLTPLPAGDIGRVTTGGKFSLYFLPRGQGAPHSIVTGPDGNLWIAFSGAIGRLAPNARPGELSLGPASSQGKHKKRHKKHRH
jgi:virginiamycin B lyase